MAEKDFVGYTLYPYLENNSEYLSKPLEVKKDYKRLLSGPNNENVTCIMSLYRKS